MSVPTIYGKRMMTKYGYDSTLSHDEDVITGMMLSMYRLDICAYETYMQYVADVEIESSFMGG